MHEPGKQSQRQNKGQKEVENREMAETERKQKNGYENCSQGKMISQS